MPFIYLRWIGAVDLEPGLMDWLGSRVVQAFGAPFRALEAATRPLDAFDPGRRQFSSTKILRWTLAHHPPDALKVVSITDGDLFIPVLTFVFGEAQVGGTAAVVSTARLRPEFHGQPPDPARFRARLEATRTGDYFPPCDFSRPSCVTNPLTCTAHCRTPEQAGTGDHHVEDRYGQPGEGPPV